MAYRDFKDLLRKTAFDRVLHDKAFNEVFPQYFIIS